MFSFTQIEKRDLLIGTLIFVVVELSIAIYDFDTLLELLILALFIIPLWFLHELAHKFVAQGNGLTSNFRLDPNMAIFSLFSIVPVFPVKIIAPGVVLSSGTYRPDTEARIAMAGPLLNILLGGLFLFFSALMPLNFTNVLLFVSRVSIDLALFNLIPFSILDGAKVYRWHSGVFGVIMGITVILWLFHPFRGIFIV
ncbi:MAG: hypothetical protein JSW11_06195 [Candidatus Heimdallarchaeota archaeon]|nr:MAG: hypothetical protein JSW11_06195 [Candidatus Heimdallarchaeota archaeon]